MKNKILSLEIPTHSEHSGHLKIDHTCEKFYIIANGKKYILNNCAAQSPCVEAWGTFDGNYYLISKSEIVSIEYVKRSL